MGGVFQRNGTAIRQAIGIGALSAIMFFTGCKAADANAKLIGGNLAATGKNPPSTASRKDTCSCDTGIMRLRYWSDQAPKDVISTMSYAIAGGIPPSWFEGLNVDTCFLPKKLLGDAYLYRAMAKAQMDSLDEADKDFHTAISLGCRNSDAYLIYATNPTWAPYQREDIYRAIVSAFPDLNRVSYEKGLNGDYGVAIDDFTRIIENSKGRTDSASMWLLEQAYYQRALAYRDWAGLERDNGFADLYFNNSIADFSYLLDTCKRENYILRNVDYLAERAWVHQQMKLYVTEIIEEGICSPWPKEKKYYDGAVKFYDYPSSSAYSEMGLVYLHRRDYQEAISSLTKAISSRIKFIKEIEGDGDLALRAKAYFLGGEYGKAAEDYDLLARYDTTGHAKWNRWGIIIEGLPIALRSEAGSSEDWPKWRDWNRMASQKHRAPPRAVAEQLNFEKSVQLLGSAIKAYETAKYDSLNHEVEYLLLGGMKYYREGFAKVAKTFSHLIDGGRVEAIDSSDIESVKLYAAAFTFRGRCREAMGMGDAAIEDYVAAMELVKRSSFFLSMVSPSAGDACAHAVGLLEKRGDYGRALEILDKYLPRRPYGFDADMSYKKGYLYFKMGDMENARRYFNEAASWDSYYKGQFYK